MKSCETKLSLKHCANPVGHTEPLQSSTAESTSKTLMRAPEQTRVLFLDFDGVLHAPKAIAGARPPLTPAQIRAGWPNTFQHLPLLAQLLQGHSDVAVVVSSSWRLFLSEVELEELLSPIAPRYAGALQPRMTQRDEAIKAWLAQNNITDFAVLDDVPRFFSGYLSQWPQLIVCNAALGIADFHVQQRLQAWLNSQTEV